MVRGKSVNFFARTINSLFGTPSINTLGELQEFMEDYLPLDTICEWLRFVSARLLTTTHTFNVTKEHAVVIYEILTNIPFEIGRFLHRSIWKSAMGGLSIGLYHPSLITTLCARASLERQLGDKMLQPESIVASPTMNSSSGLEERVDRLADEVHQLQLRQEQQFAYQHQWWALWTDQMNIPIRPHYPLDESAEPPPANMGDE
ncbi:hypothetical protein CDL12_11063 [Handroanthus impetiginosus]|uniref:Putative plant transposon protein domain-containing protein n=1 Tax=Handroanthus impetiginosus TaxID=429701 RepID=A0A2G9HFK6_9LAMI|nr:hypothetical protein CDL12_11063 [Handroanthus impetiginosus]